MTTKVNLPESWQRLRLKDCLDSLSSGARPTGGSEAGSGEVFSLGGEHINDQGGFDWSNPQYVPWSFYESIREDAEVAVNDILINKDGAKTGKLAIVREGFPHGPCCINEHVFRLRADTELADPRFLFYSLLAHHGQTQITRTIQGSAQGGINKTFAKQVYVSFPTQISEQQCIADVLVLTDDAIAAAEAKLTAARRLKTALMQQLFTRGIPGRHSRFRQTKIGEIPASWEVVPMSSVIDGTIRNGFSASESQNSTQWRVLSLDALGFDEFVPTGHKPIFWDDEIEAELAQFILKPNDLLVSRSNTPDRVGLAGLYEGSPENCIYPDLMMRFRVFENEVKPKYAEYFLRTTHARRWFQSRASGTSGSMVKIKRRDLRQLPFIKPELDEQGEICTLLEASQSTIQAIRNEISLLHRLKRSLLQNLLTGRVRVRVEAQTAMEQMPLFSSRSDGGD